MNLQEYQKLIKELCQKRGFDNDSAEEGMLLLTEEVGELAKSIRQQNSRLKNGDHSKKHDMILKAKWLTYFGFCWHWQIYVKLT